MSFVKNVFDKISSLRPDVSENDDEIFEDSAAGEDYEDMSSNTSADSIFGGSENVFGGDTVKYSPTMALENSGVPSTPTFAVPKSNTKTFGEKVKQTAAAPASNLFDIKAVKRPKFKLSFISLQDMYDAKNVANLMMENDTIVVVNIDNLGANDKRRAMDFLDGAKYVSKSVHVKFTETIYAYIPDDIELHGDFCDQVEITSFNDKNF